jgi:hypothetical protein
VISGSGAGAGSGSELGVGDSDVGVGDSVVLSAGLDNPGTVISGPDDTAGDDTTTLLLVGGVACSVGAAHDAISTAQAATPASRVATERGRAVMGPTLPSPVRGFGTFARRGRCESGGGAAAHYCGVDVSCSHRGQRPSRPATP